MSFYNISNHPTSKWSEAQLNAAKELAREGEVIDIPFPNVSPRATSKEVQDAAWELIKQIQGNGHTLMIMGETSLVFGLAMVAYVKKFRTVVATTERKVVESIDANGVAVKTATFEFVAFRDLTGCGEYALGCLVHEGL